jgi:isopenicillin-N epimerase
MPNFREYWDLDRTVTFLNHGSFGACPRPILELQSALRDQMEREPVQFLVHQAPVLLADAREFVARFLGANPDGLAFIANATTGVNAVLRSLSFEPGDELLVTDHEYNACRNVLDYVAQRSGARVVVVPVPFPLNSDEEVVDAINRCVTPRTRLLLLDHVTSATGLVMPVDRIVPQIESRGIPVLVDGAHAMGMVDLHLDALGASFYTSNAHKWLCAPKGAAILHVRHDWCEKIRPAVISHGANMPTDSSSRYRNEFDWMGTSDPTPWLCVPACLQFLESLLPGGFPELRDHNRDLVLAGRNLLLQFTGQSVPAPESMIGFIASVPLNDGPAGKASALYVDPLQQSLWDRFRIEVPIHPWPQPGKRLIRISAQIYNTIEDYKFLARALEALEADDT